MKLPSLQLSLEQKDKLADFLVTVAAGWFGATVITPFFLPPSVLTITLIGRTTIGGFLSLVFLYLSLKIVKGNRLL